jgi:hypothetical protein
MAIAVPAAARQDARWVDPVGRQRGSMRIAVTIIAGGLALVMAVQSWTESMPVAGDAGWLIALLYLLGAGFAYNMPALAATTFGSAGMTSLGIAANTGVDVFRFWGAVALVLATLSLIGWREKRRAFRRQVVHRAIDEALVPIDAAPLPRPDRSRTCPHCGAAVAGSAGFCERCGLALTMPPVA